MQFFRGTIWCLNWPGWQKRAPLIKISSDSSILTCSIYVFEKGCFLQSVYKRWTEEGSFYVTGFNERSNYEVISKLLANIHDFFCEGTNLDQIVILESPEGTLKARLITCKDPSTDKIFRFLSNLFDFQSHTIVLPYKNR
jgi:hypothetical protein